MLIDLHAYTERNGGDTLDTIVANAARRGVDAVLVADRDASGDTARAVVANDLDVPIFVGVEITTRAGDVIVVTPELDPVMTREEWRELTALDRPDLSEVVEWAAAHGGVALLSHPYDRTRRAAPRDRMFAASGVAGVEVGNDGADPRANRTALEAVGRSALPGFGGSARPSNDGDGHWLTLFAEPVTTQAELVDAIVGGDFWAVQVGGAPTPKPRGERRGGRSSERRGSDRRGKRDGDRRPREGRRNRR